MKSRSDEKDGFAEALAFGRKRANAKTLLNHNYFVSSCQILLSLCLFLQCFFLKD
jgi:hypothetical protein